MSGSWLVRRLRAAPGTVLAFAVLVLLTACAAAALPRVLDAYGDSALRQTLRDAPYGDRMITGTTSSTPRSVQPELVDAAAAAFRDAIDAPLRIRDDAASYGVRNIVPAPADDPGLPRPSGLDPQFRLVAQPDPAAHTRLVSGRMPGPEATIEDHEMRVEGVLTPAVADALHLKVGETIHLPGPSVDTTVHITGLVKPRAPHTAYWDADPALYEPELLTYRPPHSLEEKHYWYAGVLLDPRAAPALMWIDGRAEVYFHEPLDVGTLHADEVAAMQRRLADLTVGPSATKLAEQAGLGALTIDEGLAGQLTEFRQARAAVTPMLLTAELGLGTAALTVLLLWGVLTAERRREETLLLRARGGSLPGIARLLLAETAVVAVPAGAAGAGLAVALTPGGGLAQSMVQAAVVLLVACLAFPLRAAAALRNPGAQGRRADVLHARPSRRRVVVELTVLLLVVGAVVALRQRGTTADDSAATQPDPLLAAVPVLLAVAVALVLLRVAPVPLRLLARPTARGRGLVAFLGMARAGRAPSAAVAGLPLLTVLVALTVTAFGGTVLQGVQQGRERASLLALGADARVEASSDLSPGLQEKVRDVPGVDETTAVRVETRGELSSGDAVIVVLVHADSYARLADRTGLGAFPAHALHGTGSGPLPALVSPDLAAGIGDGAKVSVPGVEVPVHPVLQRETTPAVGAGSFVVVDVDALAKVLPRAAAESWIDPNTLLVSGDALDSRALNKLVASQDADDLVVRLRSDELAAYSHSVLQSGGERLYIAAALLTAAYGAMAVLLSLLQTAPGRVALLARLRTLGLPRRDGRRLLLAEGLPGYVLTAVAGVLTGLAAVPLLGPGIDLAALAGTPENLPVHPGADPVSLTLPAVGLLVLATAALLVQARAAHRSPDLSRETT